MKIHIRQTSKRLKNILEKLLSSMISNFILLKAFIIKNATTEHKIISPQISGVEKIFEKGERACYFGLQGTVFSISG